MVCTDRIKILSLLDEYLQRNINEAFLIKKFQYLILKEKNCFSRSNRQRHITVSVWLLDINKKNVALCYHRKLQKWIQLGGHTDNEKNLHKVALKEASEESGIKNIRFLSDNIFHINIYRVPLYKGDTSHFHYDFCFLTQTIDNNRLFSNKETIDICWVNIEKISSYNNEKVILVMKEKIKKYRIKF